MEWVHRTRRGTIHTGVDEIRSFVFFIKAAGVGGVVFGRKQASEQVSDSDA